MSTAIADSDHGLYSVTRPYEYRLFWSLDNDGDGLVERADLERECARNGLTHKDPRLSEVFAALDAMASDRMDFAGFLRITQSASALTEQMLRGELALPDFAELSHALNGQFAEVERNESGHQATYIPPLADVNPDQFAMAVVSVDGQLLELGDSDTDFSVQSACKPFNYCFASNDLGEETVHRHIGMEPSGQAFNARVLMGDGTGRPHNPMINAGAIMACALIRPDQPIHKRLDHVRDMWAKMTGGSRPRFDAFMAQEEGRTGDNNRALGYMMKAAGVLPKGEDATDHELRDGLELYFSICALAMNARELATAAATLANNGVCPITRERVFDERTVRNCLTLMQSCGMYDASGEFSFHIGLPAKSGVGGAVFLVVPRLMGICVWSPRLDEIGNSVRGVDMAKRLAKAYRLHVFDGASETSQRIDPRIPAARLRARRTSRVLRAADLGDLHSLQHIDDPTELGHGDYDARTPLHLAAAGGHLEVARFLLDSGTDPNPADRWGGTPLHDAKLAENSALVELLTARGAHGGDPAHPESETGATEAAELYGDTDAVVELLWAASEGDLDGLRRCIARGIPVSAADYDGRTALHLAASNGQAKAVTYLLAHDHPIHVRDRWSATPLDDARREGHGDVAGLLAAAEQAFHALTIGVNVKELSRASRFIKRLAAAYDIAPPVSHRVNVVLDEALSSVMDHAQEDKSCGRIELSCDVKPEHLCLHITYDGVAFDVLSSTDQGGDEVELIGMGSKLIRKLADSADYQREGDANMLSLTFGLKSSIAPDN
jgi:glutaminase